MKTNGTLLAFVAVCITGWPSLAAAECKPYFGDDASIQYREYERSRYTICYGPDREHLTDLNLVRKWVDASFRLGREKYKVTTPRYRDRDLKLTIYLPPKPTAATREGVVRFACCYSDRHGTPGVNGEAVLHAEIHYLTPAAWQGHRLGGLLRPPEHYHPHYITHETMHYFQFACCRREARDRGYRAPTWITEGGAESDGYLHTTEFNRTEAVRRLGLKFVDDELGSVVWGRGLDLKRTFHVSSVWWAGGFLMNYLAETYGDAIHRELLLDGLGTVLERYTSSITDLFVDLVVLADELLEDFDGTETYFQPRRSRLISTPRAAAPQCRMEIVEP